MTVTDEVAAHIRARIQEIESNAERDLKPLRRALRDLEAARRGLVRGKTRAPTQTVRKAPRRRSVSTEAVYGALKKARESTASSLAESLKANSNTVLKHLHALREGGKVAREGERAKTVWRVT